jgi:hypothetical protein
MAEEKYLKKALQMLILDLAEIWLNNDSTNPRDLEELTDSLCQKIAKKITAVTNKGISSRSIRDFKNEKSIGLASTRDIIAASWFVATGRRKKQEFNQIDGGITDGYWDLYMEQFMRRKVELNNFLGRHEGIKHEFQVKLISPQDIAVLISAFSNTEGGCVIFGVERDDTTLCGIESTSPAIKNMGAALRYFGDKKPEIEYGWGYILKSNKLFFVINIYKSNSSELFKADGKAYLRKGAGNILLDEIEYEGGSYEPATLSREQLIENFRSIRSIINDLLDYHSNHKRKQVSNHERATFFHISNNFISDVFLSFLSNIWKEVGYKETPVDKLHLYEHVKKNIDHSIAELKKGKVSLFLESIKSVPEIHTIILQHLDIISKLVQNSSGEITHKDLFNSITLLDGISKQIDVAANEKYKLTRNQVRV